MELGSDWIHLLPVPDRTLDLGDRVGCWTPRESPLPVPEAGGLVLSLVALSRCALPPGWGLEGASAVWEVLACEESARVVPGLRVFSHPSPPCGICPACRSDAHALCADSRRRPSGPGWFSRHRVLHPWSARRGTVSLPSDIDPGAASLLEPLSRILRLERRFSRRDRVVVVGGGLLAALAGIAMEGPRRRVLLGPDPDGRSGERGFHRACSDVRDALEALEGPADLVVLADGSESSVGMAARLLAPGTSVASLGPLRSPAGILESLQGMSASWVALEGSSPDDWSTAARRLPALADRLSSLGALRLPLERAEEAGPLLAADPTLLRIELS